MCVAWRTAEVLEQFGDQEVFRCVRADQMDLNKAAEPNLKWLKNSKIQRVERKVRDELSLKHMY